MAWVSCLVVVHLLVYFGVILITACWLSPKRCPGGAEPCRPLTASELLLRVLWVLFF